MTFNSYSFQWERRNKASNSVWLISFVQIHTWFSFSWTFYVIWGRKILFVRWGISYLFGVGLIFASLPLKLLLYERLSDSLNLNLRVSGKLNEWEDCVGISRCRKRSSPSVISAIIVSFDVFLSSFCFLLTVYHTLRQCQRESKYAADDVEKHSQT